MTLPGNGITWPPPPLASILPQMGAWSAWYTGDPDQLSAVYGGAMSSDPSATGFFASDHGGFRATVGRALSRWFWGEATRGPDRKVKLHVPIAAEMCQASADLLFADQATFTIDDQKTQDRLNDLTDDGMHAEFAAAAESCAALGGVYLRVTWDDTINPEAPFITHVDADQAWPEFRWGQLTAVTFWQVVNRDGKKVYRHLEKHETDAQGNGIILHGLYEGTENNLGQIVPLTEQQATAGLADHVNAFGFIDSESEGLCVVYVPNQAPSRRWRTDPLGRNLGRSDLDGVEQLMDALDETYTSWMRDIRLGKARLVVPKSYLENVGPGNGRAFDAEQEVYAPVNALTGKDQPMGQQMQQVQFNIRVLEHKDTAQQLVENILQMAGYSMQTFGVGDTGSVRTATEIESKERRSLMTRDRKLREWRPALAKLVHKLLLVDQALFGSQIKPAEPDVLFADQVQQTQLALAQTAQALYSAQSASTKVRVQALHPDWDEDDVLEEVALIRAENGLPDPLDLHPGPPNGDGPQVKDQDQAVEGGGAGGAIAGEGLPDKPLALRLPARRGPHGQFGGAPGQGG